MKIGDRVFVRGYVDKIRKDTVIVRNNGGYFGTIPSEVITGELPSAQLEQRWIPCSERLPDGRLNKSYLVQDKDGRRAVGTYTNWGWMFAHYMNDPVAWMPLPEPYEEGT